MSITILFLAVMATIVAWWLSRQRLMAKPWLEEGAIGDFPDTGASSLPAAKIGLGVFLAVVGSLFALLIGAYSMQMNMADWRPLPAPKLLWLNTGVLILSSVALQWAQVAAHRGQMDGMRAGLLAGGASALAFLAGQLLVWQQLTAAGYFLATNPAYAFFYLITGVHGLHLLGGLVALGRTTDKVWRGFEVDQVRLSVELCTLYWHFLLLVWRPAGWQGIAADWSSDQRAFKNVSWGKAMMWIFLLSDTFIFSCFLLSYMTDRMSTTVPWPNPSEVFALTIGGTTIPLILIAIMTFILISSSGTMAMAVNFGYRRDRVKSAALMLATAAFGATFVGMQAFEWTKLIMEGVRPWGNPWGAAQFGSSFFMITGFHGTHVSIGVIFLIIMARKVWRGDFDRERRGFFTSRKGNYEIVEIMGLYWHFVDLVWVFIFALFYLW